MVNVAHPYNVTFKICVFYDQTKAHQSGSTVPIKMAVCDVNDVNVSLPSIVLTATGVTLLSTNAPGPLEDAGNANPDNEFRFVQNVVHVQPEDDGDVDGHLRVDVYGHRRSASAHGGVPGQVTDHGGVIVRTRRGFSPLGGRV